MSANTYSHVYHDDGACPCFLSIPTEGMETFRHRFIEVVQKDSPGKTFGFSIGMQNVSCFDLDEAVDSLGGNKPSSMDCIIRIGNYNAVNEKLSNTRWLLVEFKLNSKKAQKDSSDLKKKVKATERGLIGENVDPSRNFIYPDEVYPQKKSYFNNWKRASDGAVYKYWNCFSPARFEQFLLFQEKLPYKPENKLEDIRADILLCNDAEDFDSRLCLWRKKAEIYKTGGNSFEHDHILASMNNVFQNYMACLAPSEDKEYLNEEWSFLSKYNLEENNC